MGLKTVGPFYWQMSYMLIGIGNQVIKYMWLSNFFFFFFSGPKKPLEREAKRLEVGKTSPVVPS